MGKAQGSLEYLILVAVALAVAAVAVIFVTGGMGGQKQSAQWDLCRGAANQCKSVHSAAPSDPCDFCNASCSDPTTNEIISNKALECCKTGHAESIYPEFNGACTQATPSNQPPVANAGLDHNCLTIDPCPFDGSGSFDPDGNITSYSWQTEPGKTVTGKTPSYVYNTVGVKSVTLMVTDNSGATDTDGVAVTVTAKPLPDLYVPNTPTPGFTVSNSNPGYKDTIILTVKVSNKGTADANNVRVDYYSYQEDGYFRVVNETFLFTDTVPKISVGSTVTLTRTWSAQRPGNFGLSVRLDPTRAIMETDESNNEAHVFPISAVDNVPPVLNYFEYAVAVGTVITSSEKGVHSPALYFAANYVNVTFKANATDISGLANISILLDKGLGYSLVGTCAPIANDVDCRQSELNIPSSSDPRQAEVIICDTKGNCLYKMCNYVYADINNAGKGYFYPCIEIGPVCPPNCGPSGPITIS
jgi:uncharacterized protein (UPF0333 family)